MGMYSIGSPVGSGTTDVDLTVNRARSVHIAGTTVAASLVLRKGGSDIATIPIAATNTTPFQVDNAGYMELADTLRIDRSGGATVVDVFIAWN